MSVCVCVEEGQVQQVPVVGREGTWMNLKLKQAKRTRCVYCYSYWKWVVSGWLPARGTFNIDFMVTSLSPSLPGRGRARGGGQGSLIV